MLASILTKSLPFVTVTRVMDFNLSNPVRGADGLPKSCMSGGVMRQYLSSQSLKWHLRQAAEASAALAAMQAAAGRTFRSTLIGERLIFPALEAQGLSTDDAKAYAKACIGLYAGDPEKKAKAEEAAAAAAATETKRKAKAKAKFKAKAADVADTVDDDAVTDEADEAAPAQAKRQSSGSQPLVVGAHTIDAMIAMALTLARNGVAPEDMYKAVRSGGTGQPQAVVDAIAALQALRGHAGLNAAWSGSFAPGVAAGHIDAAIHVAHAMTTHPIQSTADFFAVTDQLKDREAGESGGSHINTQEYGSGIFLMTMVINPNQLVANLPMLSGEQIREQVEWLIGTFATFIPAAKLGATAPYTDSGEVLVEVGDRPVNHARAFTKTSAWNVEDAFEMVRAHAATVAERQGALESFTFASVKAAGHREPLVVRIAELAADAALGSAVGAKRVA